MASLDAGLGFRLCSRGRVGFQLTEDGLRVYEALKRLDAAFTQFHRDVGQHQEIPGGTLRIRMVDAVATVRPTALIQSFVARTYMQGWTPRGLRFNDMAWTSDIEAIAALVLCGEYLSYLPEIYSLPWVERGLMRPMKRNQLSYRSRVCAVTRKSPNSKLADLFCSLIAAATKDSHKAP
jgi:DNA-binding transcriptional LysR family regulator